MLGVEVSDRRGTVMILWDPSFIGFQNGAVCVMSAQKSVPLAGRKRNSGKTLEKGEKTAMEPPSENLPSQARGNALLGGNVHIS